MKEVTIDGVVYVPKVPVEKVLWTSLTLVPAVLSYKSIKKMEAYNNILQICEYLNNEFVSDGSTWMINKSEKTICVLGATRNIYHFTSEKAAEYALLHFKQVFTTFLN